MEVRVPSGLSRQWPRRAVGLIGTVGGDVFDCRVDVHVAIDFAVMTQFGWGLYASVGREDRRVMMDPGWIGMTSNWVIRI